MRWGLWLSTFGYQRGRDILHFAQAFFLEFRVASLSRKTLRAGGRSQDLVHDQNLVCAPPSSQSPAGLPAAPVLLAAPALRAWVTLICPELCVVTRERIFSKFDLPAPFLPMIPSTSPRLTSNGTSFST